MAGQPKRRAQEGRPPAPGARGYKWRDAWPGNELALIHGAHSSRRVAPVAEALLEQLPAAAPWLDREAFTGALQSWSWVEAQLVLLRAYVDEHGLLDDEGEERPAVRLMTRLEARASTLRGELGLTPLSLARLLGTLAQVATAGGDQEGLAALKREGVRILATRTSPGDPEAAA